MEFKLAKDRKLFWLKNKTWWEVELKACFPTSHPDKYFSIRDEKGQELALLESLNSLDDQNKQIVERYLKFKSFVFEIKGVYEIEEDYGLRHFEVKTNKGDRVFQTALDEWPYHAEDGTIIFDDLHGEQYHVRNLEFGHKILEAYL